MSARASRPRRCPNPAWLDHSTDGALPAAHRREWPREPRLTQGSQSEAALKLVADSLDLRRDESHRDDPNLVVQFCGRIAKVDGGLVSILLEELSHAFVAFRRVRASPLNDEVPPVPALVLAGQDRAQQARDADTTARLTVAGWTVLCAWEHDDADEVVARIARLVANSRAS